MIYTVKVSNLPILFTRDAQEAEKAARAAENKAKEAKRAFKEAKGEACATRPGGKM